MSRWKAYLPRHTHLTAIWIAKCHKIVKDTNLTKWHKVSEEEDKQYLWEMQLTVGGTMKRRNAAQAQQPQSWRSSGSYATVDHQWLMFVTWDAWLITAHLYIYTHTYINYFKYTCMCMFVYQSSALKNWMSLHCWCNSCGMQFLRLTVWRANNKHVVYTYIGTYIHTYVCLVFGDCTSNKRLLSIKEL